MSQSTLLKTLSSPNGWEDFCKLCPQEPHPVYPEIPREGILERLRDGWDEQRVLDQLQRRAKLIARERVEPIHFGYQPKMWLDADEDWCKCRELLVLGSNRSGKTEYAARRVVELLLNKPGSIVWCFSTSSETSVRDQQRAVSRYLPLIWRNNRRGKTWNMNCTVKRGFTDKAFVAPNGSECRFMNYMQDADVIEGGQVDLWWADELVPADWIITLRSRVIDRKGRGIVTQTPIKGYTPTVAEYLAGARVAEWADCELLPTQIHWPGGKPGKVPYRMECLNPSNRVIFFHAKHNPYVSYEDLVNSWKDKGSVNILVRIYGVTSGISNCKFPRFGSQNLVSEEAIPAQGTNYHVTDFSWSKPWTMLWARIREVAGRKFCYVYREWPDLDSYGEWVVRSEQPDGAPGPAQAPCGYGIGDYKRLILDLERPRRPDGTVDTARPGEPVYARFGDPRSGAATALAEEGATTIFQMLSAEDAGTPSMLIQPVAGTSQTQHILEGVNLINTWLEYDTDRPIDQLNCPRLYISQKCQNLISCLKMWTGAQGQKGASKDFVDLLRYLAMMDPEDQTQAGLIPLRRGGAY